MKNLRRRTFLRSVSLTGVSLALEGRKVFAAKEDAHTVALRSHVIKEVELVPVTYRWPRFVGKNARRGFHGTGPKRKVCRLVTDQGAVGWGNSGPKPEKTIDLDVYLTDIVGYGFTHWRKLMPRIEAMGVMASPHAWGDAAKTNSISHLSAGMGNTVTIEGVTCSSDEIDFGDYHIKNGLLHVSDAPGFGMKLLV